MTTVVCQSVSYSGAQFRRLLHVKVERMEQLVCARVRMCVCVCVLVCACVCVFCQVTRHFALFQMVGSVYKKEIGRLAQRVG